MEFITRSDKGSALTHDEMDTNFRYLFLLPMVTYYYPPICARKIIDEVDATPITLDYHYNITMIQDESSFHIAILPNSKLLNINFSYDDQLGYPIAGILAIDMIDLRCKQIMEGVQSTMIQTEAELVYCLVTKVDTYNDGAELNVTIHVTEDI